MLQRNKQVATSTKKQQSLGQGRFEMKNGTGVGEIVQVQGGHVVRSINRKDRHSKVYTAKGHRDRRLRLSAPTAIEFYDVQDRLGYDRPSEAVDWLIEKAKSAIDKLAELPPWQPNIETSTAPVEAESNNNSSGYNFHNNYMNPSEDLDLSLHSFQDPGGLIHGQSGFEANFDRIVSWNENTSTENRGGGGLEFSSIPIPQNQTMLSQFSQREPLQSSFTNYVRAWNDLPIADAEHKTHHFGSEFVVFDGLPAGFCIPARIHEHRPNSSSSPSSNQ